MKYLVLISTLLLFACEEEEKGTTISGTVVFEDTVVAFDSLLATVTGTDDKFPIQHTVVGTSVTLDKDMRFEASFPYIEEANYYSIIIIIYENGIGIGGANPNDLNCSPYNCNELAPGKTYDLTIRMTEDGL